MGLVDAPQDKNYFHEPAVNTIATISVPAQAGRRPCCTGIQLGVRTGTVAPAAASVTAVRRDGATGAGTILWQMTIPIGAVANSIVNLVIAGIHLPGTSGNAMTLEFTAAGGANTFETVNLQAHHE